ncbi:hypothetical protein NDU88_010178 [Pleurodeles waltl]|uniref:Uncharacterized protein n=1 Tax=Pleurodeles waltl TaxID=8319 RepID=A0AAV7S0J5_PLEWA|nr:hypothetical protein NDU88_010178 [Pleurodeles waltl]
MKGTGCPTKDAGHRSTFYDHRPQSPDSSRTTVRQPGATGPGARNREGQRLAPNSAERAWGVESTLSGAEQCEGSIEATT